MHFVDDAVAFVGAHARLSDFVLLLNLPNLSIRFVGEIGGATLNNLRREIIQVRELRRKLNFRSFEYPFLFLEWLVIKLRVQW
jgi:hypothetical protein